MTSKNYQKKITFVKNNIDRYFQTKKITFLKSFFHFDFSISHYLVLIVIFKKHFVKIMLMLINIDISRNVKNSFCEIETPI